MEEEPTRPADEERDELWASLGALRPVIDRLAMGEFDGSARQQQMVTLLAKIVAAEMDFREERRGRSGP